ncbi:polysaccharide deacetylase family protein [Mucilaginibacter myungsuensis]|uniref:Polysaccharide deacetylase family protein n=1 Tax=Mucilaginibacter myungsuensis TaxID=649104 RepID=A0A929KTX4_9SPHI|nr:polysaccharide deacetylase family protein [Mucilaginibacter myungsuensis]MBE9660343.1 polysaccharide deacetylase family protein [Mucilaginibacter myungsuensis]MDN3600385.1 polysaccharide deacetylase family protein [Mucilaginibacter myungsuensis]
MILLSFDIEEFDMPFEYGKSLDFDEQLAVSTEGTLAVLDILREAGIKATFYCTANYAKHKQDVVKQIVAEGHELASHGYFHSEFIPAHLASSKKVLEELFDTPVSGYRMARMMPVDEREIQKAGYKYNSSINPTWLPGRYNNFDRPRKWFWQDGVLQLPASVSPLIRFPLFWLSFHNLPMFLIKWISGATYNKDGYLNLYFHPWEFTDLHKPEKYGFPGYVMRNTGDDFIARIKDFISWAQGKGYQFKRTGDFAADIIQKSRKQ